MKNKELLAESVEGRMTEIVNIFMFNFQPFLTQGPLIQTQIL